MLKINQFTTTCHSGVDLAYKIDCLAKNCMPLDYESYELNLIHVSDALLVFDQQSCNMIVRYNIIIGMRVCIVSIYVMKNIFSTIELGRPTFVCLRVEGVVDFPAGCCYKL